MDKSVKGCGTIVRRFFDQSEKCNLCVQTIKFLLVPYPLKIEQITKSYRYRCTEVLRTLYTYRARWLIIKVMHADPLSCFLYEFIMLGS